LPEFLQILLYFLLCSSAAFIARIFRPVDGASFGHVRIGIHRGVVRQHHAIISKQLAVGEGGVCLDTLLGPLEVQIVNVEGVDVARAKLSRIYLIAKVVEKTGNFVHSGNVSGTDI